jgi:hypothetical protein
VPANSEEVPWFTPAIGPDDDSEQVELSHGQARFVKLLRERAEEWPEDPEPSRLELPVDGRIQVWLDLDDRDDEVIVATVGVPYFRQWRFADSGKLARATAEWFQRHAARSPDACDAHRAGPG